MNNTLTSLLFFSINVLKNILKNHYLAFLKTRISSEIFRRIYNYDKIETYIELMLPSFLVSLIFTHNKNIIITNFIKKKSRYFDEITANITTLVLVLVIFFSISRKTIFNF